MWDSFLGSTVGQIWSAASGNVDPWTAAAQKADLAKAAVQALGSNPSDADVAAAVAASNSIYEQQLTAAGANPNNGCILNLPILGCVAGGPGALQNLKKIVDTAIFVIAFGGVVYFGIKYRKSIAATARAAKKDLSL